MRVLVPLGTRPEIVKLAPVVHAFRRAGVEVRVVATGQHYDRLLAGTFFDELDMEPDARWELPGGEAERVGRLLELALGEVGATAPDAVVVLGDTYTVPAFALAARRHRVPMAHVEAGLRSFNDTSMEELNRKIAAAGAALHFAPTDLAARFLEREGVDGARVRVVGNPVIDALRLAGIGQRPVAARSGTVLTAHRATNVDDPARLRDLVTLALGLAETVPPLHFPVHPRTRSRLRDAGLEEKLDHPSIRLTDPLPYAEMLDAVAGCRVAVTDSGGLQEEASYLGVPLVVLRPSTPRWEGVRDGTSVLVGVDAERALDAAVALAADDAQERVAAVPCPYGDGFAADRIAAVLTDPDVAPLLRVEEPQMAARELPW